MKSLGFVVSIAATCALLSSTSAYAVTEISWWHAMTGANNEVVEELSKEFNESQAEYKVVPVFKGTYPETLNAGIAAFRAKQPPGGFRQPGFTWLEQRAIHHVQCGDDGRRRRLDTHP